MMKPFRVGLWMTGFLCAVHGAISEEVLSRGDPILAIDLRGDSSSPAKEGPENANDRDIAGLLSSKNRRRRLTRMLGNLQPALKSAML